MNGGGAFSLATAYASAVSGASSAGTLFSTTGSAGGTPGAPAVGSTVDQLIATTGGAYTYPAGYNYFTAQTVSPVTIDATAATSAQSLHTLVGTGGATYFAGNETSSTFIAGGGNNVFIGSGTGTYQIATSDGNDRILTGSGNATVDAGTGNNFVLLGAGADSVTSSGVDSIYAGSGNDTVTFDSLSGGGSTVYGSSGPLTVNDEGVGGNSISGGAGGATVFAGASDTISAIGNTQVFAQGPGVLVNDSGTASSTLLFVGASGAATVNAGSANTLLFGTSGSNINYTGGGIIVAGGGNETLNGSGSTQGFAGFVSNVDANRPAGASTNIVGGSGADTLVAGLGAQTLSGGLGANLFVIAKNGTSDAANPGANITVSDFGSSASNTIGLFGYGVQASTVLSQAINTQGGAQIRLSDNTTVTFTGLTTQTLTNHGGIFGAG